MFLNALSFLNSPSQLNNCVPKTTTDSEDNKEELLNEDILNDFEWNKEEQKETYNAVDKFFGLNNFVEERIKEEEKKTDVVDQISNNLVKKATLIILNNDKNSKKSKKSKKSKFS